MHHKSAASSGNTPATVDQQALLAALAERVTATRTASTVSIQNPLINELMALIPRLSRGSLARLVERALYLTEQQQITGTCRVIPFIRQHEEAEAAFNAARGGEV